MTGTHTRGKSLPGVEEGKITHTNNKIYTSSLHRTYNSYSNNQENPVDLSTSFDYNRKVAIRVSSRAEFIYPRLRNLLTLHYQLKKKKRRVKTTNSTPGARSPLRTPYATHYSALVCRCSSRCGTAHPTDSTPNSHSFDPSVVPNTLRVEIRTWSYLCKGNIVSDVVCSWLGENLTDLVIFGGTNQGPRTLEVRKLSHLRGKSPSWLHERKLGRTASGWTGHRGPNAITTSKNLSVSIELRAFLYRSISNRFNKSFLYRLWPTSCPITSISCAAPRRGAF